VNGCGCDDFASIFAERTTFFWRVAVYDLGTAGLAARA
jgi:hypothetical protein